MDNKEFRFDSNFIFLEDYKALIESNFFDFFKKSSYEFLKLNESFLTDYFGKWSKDPLNNWSRKWEYPFVYHNITKTLENYINSEKNEESGLIKILDAGSGITFFPYLLNSDFHNVEITALDYDPSYIPVFREINKQMQTPIRFINGSLDSLPFPDQTFNIVYCISTLEHTGNFDKIILEFSRILKPNGKLILTIDVSEQKEADIPINKANELHNLITSEFNAQISENANPIPSDLFAQDILTTKYAYKYYPESLWGFNFVTKAKYFLSHLIKRGKFRIFPDNITVFCEVYSKKS